MRRIRYFIDLEPGRDRIRVDFETDFGRVTGLHVVQYETAVEGAWAPVARYDAAHGFLHVDLYTKNGNTKYRLHADGLGDALTLAIEDLKANWRTYRTAFRGV